MRPDRMPPGKSREETSTLSAFIVAVRYSFFFPDRNMYKKTGPGMNPDPQREQMPENRIT